MAVSNVQEQKLITDTDRRNAGYANLNNSNDPQVQNTTSQLEELKQMFESYGVSPQDWSSFFNNLVTGKLDEQRRYDFINYVMKMNAQQVDEARRYNENLANTAVQRRVADLKAAGINPLFAVGHPADSPIVAPAQASGSMSSVPTAMTGIISTILNNSTQLNIAGIKAITSILGSAMSAIK